MSASNDILTLGRRPSVVPVAPGRASGGRTSRMRSGHPTPIQLPPTDRARLGVASRPEADPAPRARRGATRPHARHEAVGGFATGSRREAPGASLPHLRRSDDVPRVREEAARTHARRSTAVSSAPRRAAAPEASASRPRATSATDDVRFRLTGHPSAAITDADEVPSARGHAAAVAGRAGARVAGVAGWAVVHKAIAIALAAVVLAAAMLYPPARAYYTAARTHAILSERLDQANVGNDVLQSEVDSLMTREGIEDEARRRGYVAQGDTAVDMSGVDDAGGATSDSSVTQAESSQDQQTPWYTPMLDALFGYDASTQGVG